MLKQKSILAVLVLLIAASLACSMPLTPVATPTATSTQLSTSTPTTINILMPPFQFPSPWLLLPPASIHQYNPAARTDSASGPDGYNQ